MASLTVVFNRILFEVGNGFDFDADTVVGMLVDKDTWVPNADNDFVQTILTAGADELTDGSYSRQTASGKSVALDDTGDRGTWVCGTFTFGALVGAEDYDTFVLYHEVTNDADSTLMAAWDLGPQTTDGTPVLVIPGAILTEVIWVP